MLNSHRPARSRIRRPTAKAWLYSTSESLAPNTGIPVDTANPTCQTQQSSDAVKVILQSAPALVTGNYKNAAGDLLKFMSQTPVYADLVSKTSGVVHDFILRNGPKSQHSTCVLLSVVVPKDALIVGVRLHNHDIDAAAADPGVFATCQPAIDCPNGWSKFLGYPETTDDANAKAVSTIFANWSHNRRRVGKLTVFFTMPPGKTPIPLL
jgi:hypothetical protein